MWALAASTPSRARPVLAGTPVGTLAFLAAGIAAAALGVRMGWLPDAVLRVVGVAAGHGALLVTALAWAATDAGRGSRSRPVVWRDRLVPVALLAGAAAAAELGPAGAVAYAAPILWVWSVAGRALGSAPVTVRGLGVGGLAGALLGAHVLVAAAGSLDHSARLGTLGAFAAGAAYDAGANVLATECFFRGPLLDRLRRRGTFGAAAGVTTVACVARYLVDPLLPRTIEMVIGAAFYLMLLGAVNCWLVRWSGSLIPGYVAAVVFFAAYRLLGGP